MTIKNLYHKKVYWKKWFDKAVKYLINNKEDITVSRHFKVDNRERGWCGHNEITLDDLLDIIVDYSNMNRQGYLFEVETEYDTKTKYEEITKAVFRTEYDNDRDIVIVVRKNFIVTAWLQNKDDKHSTLDSRKYVNPKNRG